MANPKFKTDVDSLERAINSPKSAFPNSQDLHKHVNALKYFSEEALFELQDHAYTQLQVAEANHTRILEAKLDNAKRSTTDELPEVTASAENDMEEFSDQVKGNICQLVEQRWNCEERTAALEQL